MAKVKAKDALLVLAASVLVATAVMSKSRSRAEVRHRETLRAIERLAADDTSDAGSGTDVNVQQEPARQVDWFNEPYWLQVSIQTFGTVVAATFVFTVAVSADPDSKSDRTVQFYYEVFGLVGGIAALLLWGVLPVAILSGLTSRLLRTKTSKRYTKLRKLLAVIIAAILWGAAVYVIDVFTGFFGFANRES